MSHSQPGQDARHPRYADGEKLGAEIAESYLANGHAESSTADRYQVVLRCEAPAKDARKSVCPCRDSAGNSMRRFHTARDASTGCTSLDRGRKSDGSSPVPSAESGLQP